MRTAILGLGRMGRRHVTAVSRVSSLALVAVADLEPSALARPLPGDGITPYRDPRELLERERPELVIVATYADSHPELVGAALECGATRILCEKPVATSVAAAERMIELAARSGAALAVNHGRRHVPFYAWLADRIASGAWGRLRSIRSSCPGVGLGCLGTHYLDLARFLSGSDFARLSGWIDPERGPNPRGAGFHDPGGLVVADTGTGARCIHEQIEDGTGPAFVEITLTGAQVFVREDDCHAELRVAGDGGRAPGSERPPDEARLHLDVVELSACVLRELAEGAPLTCAAEHGARSLEAVVAAYASAAEGHRPVDLPLSEVQARRAVPIT